MSLFAAWKQHGRATRAQLENTALRHAAKQCAQLERTGIAETKPAWTTESQGGSQPVSEDPSFHLEIDQWSQGYSALKTENARAGSDHVGQDTKIETNLRLIESLVYQMLGKRIKLQMKRSETDAPGQEPMSPVQERDSWGLVYEYQEAVAEQDSIQFNSGGTVTAANDRTITF